MFAILAKFFAGSTPTTKELNFFFKIFINDPSLLAISKIFDFLFIPKLFSLDKSFFKSEIFVLDIPVSHK